MQNEVNLSLLDLPITTLEEMLGQHLLASSLASKPDAKAARRAGRNFFQAKAEEIRALVCESEAVHTYCTQQDGKDRRMICVTIVDLLASVYHGLPCATLAALVLQHGLEQFCKLIVEQKTAGIRQPAKISLHAKPKQQNVQKRATRR